MVMNRPDSRYVLHSQSGERLSIEIEHMPWVLSRKVERESTSRRRNGPDRVVFAMARSSFRCLGVRCALVRRVLVLRSPRVAHWPMVDHEP
jgi:hypothetical protein